MITLSCFISWSYLTMTLINFNFQPTAPNYYFYLAYIRKYRETKNRDKHECFCFRHNKSVTLHSHILPLTPQRWLSVFWANLSHALRLIQEQLVQLLFVSWGIFAVCTCSKDDAMRDTGQLHNKDRVSAARPDCAHQLHAVCSGITCLEQVLSRLVSPTSSSQKGVKMAKKIGQLDSWLGQLSFHHFGSVQYILTYDN